VGKGGHRYLENKRWHRYVGCRHFAVKTTRKAHKKRETKPGKLYYILKKKTQNKITRGKMKKTVCRWRST